MKYLLSMLLGVLSVSVSAADFNSKRDMMNEHLDKKITALQAAKTCVQEAKNEEALKTCKTDMKDDMAVMRKDYKDKKKEMKKQSQEEGPAEDEMPEENE